LSYPAAPLDRRSAGQSRGIEQVNHSIALIDEVTQKNAGRVVGAAAVARSDY
jgi:methyl-accepting chemotaxis protein